MRPYVPEPTVTILSMTDELRTALERAGGLHTANALAKWWGFSHEYVRSTLSRRDDFPAPAAIIGQYTLYSGNEVAEWYARHYPRRPTPGPDPREENPVR